MEGYTWDTEGKTERHRATHSKGPTSGAVRHKHKLTYLFQFSGREGLLLPFDLGDLATYIEGPAEGKEVDGWEDFLRQLSTKQDVDPNVFLGRVSLLTFTPF